MRIELRDAQRRPIGRIEADPAQRPTRVTVDGDAPREIFLDWDRAVDDAGHLRRCVACGCADLYRTKAFPQITGLVVFLAFAGAVIGALGLATTPPIFAAMVVVLVADVAILLFSKQRLVCHRCRSSYHEIPIARYHPAWDRTVAERHAPPPHQPPAAPGGRVSRLVRWPLRPGSPRLPRPPAGPPRRVLKALRS
jgi:hypothetical protein